MKKLFLTLAITIAIMGASYAQNFQLDECDMFTNKSTSLYKSAVFNTAGINLNKYDWQNKTLNCHINSTMLYAKKSSNKKLGAIIATSMGGVFIISGAPLLGSRYLGGAGAGMFAIGLTSVGGAVPLFIFSKKDKKKMDYHLDQVSEYYRTNNLF
jgi:hypothetical protein